jgi:hypothetical protein
MSLVKIPESSSVGGMCSKLKGGVNLSVLFTELLREVGGRSIWSVLCPCGFAGVCDFPTFTRFTTLTTHESSDPT